MQFIQYRVREARPFDAHRQVLTHYEMGEYLPDLLNYLNTAIATTLHTGRQQGAALTDAAYAHACERVNELGRLILAAHTATPRTFAGTDFIDALLARARQEPGAFSEALLARAALSPFLAGLNTVANSCSFLFYALLTQPQVLSRVQAEVDQALARGPLDWETLRRMQDLRGAVLETLRLYPVASGHRARVARPLTFAGYRLDVGDDLFVAMTVSHLLPHLFPEPERFDIERYRPPRNEHHQPGAFAPFGLGEHTCAGAGIAEVQMMVITATVLFTYQLALDPPDYALTIERDPTPFPGNAFRMRVVNLRHAI